MRSILAFACVAAAAAALACDGADRASADTDRAGAATANGGGDPIAADSAMPADAAETPAGAAPVASARPDGRTDAAVYGPGDADRTPNELGRIPILEYHLIGEPAGQWQVTPEAFRADLELLYERGYRPVNLHEVLDHSFDLPRGLSPVVIVFDDASPSQFRYVERADGTLVIDPTSAVGIWLDFSESHPGWPNRAVFCMLPAAEAGRSFFGDKGLEEQKSEWRFRKVRFLHEQGFELCNHTLWHANLAKYEDAFVQEQIARGELAIDSVLPGYDVRTFALPLGVWPKNRELARAGAWTDPKTQRTFAYEYDAILMVAGGPARSPHDPQFDPLKLPRFIVFGDELRKLLDRLDREGNRFVSDGDPQTVAQPPPTP